MEPNFTFFIQTAIYLFILIVLQWLYFKPLLALVKRRESMTTGRRTEADDLVKKCAELREQYQQKISTAREQFEKERQIAMKSIKSVSDESLNAAKERVENALREEREALDREIKIARGKLSALSGDLKKEIVGAMTTSRVVHL